MQLKNDQRMNRWIKEMTNFGRALVRGKTEVKTKAKIILEKSKYKQKYGRKKDVI